MRMLARGVLRFAAVVIFPLVVGLLWFVAVGLLFSAGIGRGWELLGIVVFVGATWLALWVGVHVERWLSREDRFQAGNQVGDQDGDAEWLAHRRTVIYILERRRQMPRADVDSALRAAGHHRQAIERAWAEVESLPTGLRGLWATGWDFVAGRMPAPYQRRFNIIAVATVVVALVLVGIIASR